MQDARMEIPYLAMAEKLIKLLSPKGFAHTVPLRSHGIQPHFAVSGILHCCSVSMVRVDIPQPDKGFSDRCPWEW
jgi:hypothetical protein